MSRSIPTRFGWALALLLGLTQSAGAQLHPRSDAGLPGAGEPSGVRPSTLEAWRWRQALDREPRTRIASVLAAAAGTVPTLLNDTTGILGRDQAEVAMASSPGRNIAIVYRDAQAGDGEIRMLLLDSAGSILRIGSEPDGSVLVNDDAIGADQGLPSVAMNADGEIVVAWQDGRYGEYDIFAQRFRPDGTRVGPNTKINLGRDDQNAFNHTRPRVAMDDAGRVAIAWEDGRRQTYNELYVQRLLLDPVTGLLVHMNTPIQVNAVGLVKGRQVSLRDNGGMGVMWSNQPGDSSFVVTFQARDMLARGGRRSIFARRFQTFTPLRGLPLDTAVVTVDDGGTNDTLEARASSTPVLLGPAPGDSSRIFVVAWVDSLSIRGRAAIKARRLFTSAWARGANALPEPGVRISESDSSGASPVAARVADGSVVFSWLQQFPDGKASLRVRRTSSSLVPAGATSSGSSDPSPSRKQAPSLAPAGGAADAQGYLAAWVDSRRGDKDVVLRRVTGANPGSDTTLGVTSQPDQVHPSLSLNASGQGVVAWTDFRAGYADPDIYAQRVDASGARVGPNFRVNGDGPGNWQDHPVVFVDGTGKFTVAWEDSRVGSFQVFARVFQPDGTPAGDGFAIAPTDSFQQFRPSIAGTAAGRVVLAWEDNRRGFSSNSLLHAFDIYSRPMEGGVPLGNPLRVSPLVGDTTVTAENTPNVLPKFDPTLALDENGNAFVFWGSTQRVQQSAGNLLNYDVDGRYLGWPSRKLPMVDGAGRLVSGNAFSVADSLGDGFLFVQQKPSAAYLGQGTFVVAFEDERLGIFAREDIRAQLYRVALRGTDTVQVFPDGINVLVNDDTIAQFDAARTVYYLSSSQFDPRVVASPGDSTFSVFFADRRGDETYNVMRQSFHWISGGAPGTTSRLRFLGRNTVVNPDRAKSQVIHVNGTGAYAGSGQLLTIWETNLYPGHGHDIVSFAIRQDPDTCVDAQCRRGPRIILQAVKLAGGEVRLSWNLPEGPDPSEIRLFREDLEALATNRAVAPELVGRFPSSAGAYEALDRVSGDAARYVYSLARSGEVLAHATPRTVALQFALQLSGAHQNPARGRMQVAFVVPGLEGTRADVKLSVYDVSGRRVRGLLSGPLAAGPASASWDGTGESGAHSAVGVYFVRLEAAGSSRSQKFLWLR